MKLQSTLLASALFSLAVNSAPVQSNPKDDYEIINDGYDRTQKTGGGYSRESEEPGWGDRSKDEYSLEDDDAVIEDESDIWRADHCGECDSLNTPAKENFGESDGAVIEDESEMIWGNDPKEDFEDFQPFIGDGNGGGYRAENDGAIIEDESGMRWGNDPKKDSEEFRPLAGDRNGGGYRAENDFSVIEDESEMNRNSVHQKDTGRNGGGYKPEFEPENALEGFQHDLELLFTDVQSFVTGTGFEAEQFLAQYADLKEYLMGIKKAAQNDAHFADLEGALEHVYSVLDEYKYSAEILQTYSKTDGLAAEGLCDVARAYVWTLEMFDIEGRAETGVKEKKDKISQLKKIISHAEEKFQGSGKVTQEMRNIFEDLVDRTKDLFESFEYQDEYTSRA